MSPWRKALVACWYWINYSTDFASLADIYGNDDDDDDDEEDPDWVNEEKEQFHNFRDKNHDGHLDKDEVKEWIIPEEFDHIDTETSHLIRTSDANQVCTECLAQATTDKETAQ